MSAYESQTFGCRPEKWAGRSHTHYPLTICRCNVSTIRWQVEDGLHMLQSDGADGQQPTTTDAKDRSVLWFNPGEPFRCRNAHASSQYRQICWEIKQPPKYTEDRVRALLDAAIYSTDVGTELLFENEFCRVWDFFLAPGEGDWSQPHHHVLDYAFVYVAPGRLLGSHHDGTPGLFDSINDDNDVTWFDIPEGAATDPGYAHGGKNGYDDRPMREYLVELK
jgi:hypothetical protein